MHNSPGARSLLRALEIVFGRCLTKRRLGPKMVREEGFEPSRVSPRDPKSRASAGSATLASDTSVSASRLGFNEYTAEFRTGLSRISLARPGERRGRHAGSPSKIPCEKMSE